MVCEPREEQGVSGECRGDTPANRFAVSAKLMRRIAIGHVRRAKAARRRLFVDSVPLNSELCWVGPPGQEPLDLGVALDELETHDAEKARTLDLRYFLGCSVEETAGFLGVSPSCVDSAVRFSLAWLNLRLRTRLPYGKPGMACGD